MSTKDNHNIFHKAWWFLCILTILLVPCCTLYSRSIPNNRVELKFTNNQCVIKRTIDLKGDTLFLPKNSKLVFKSGIICSGVIVGKESQIEGKKTGLFRNVTIEGTWKNKTVFSEWLDFKKLARYDNRKNFINLMTLSKGSIHTDVYMEEGVFWCSAQTNAYGFRIPSNTSFHCKATIKELPNNFERVPFIQIFKSENVTIDGGVYYGDLVEHEGETGEWSHGIECRASSNVIIKNVTCCEFWGDGIDVIDGYDDNLKPTLNCYNVVINGAKCYYNRRCGIALESVINCKMSKCECRYTGIKRGTLPMTGIAIEAWTNATEKIKNIEITDCIFEDNKDKDLFVYAHGPFKADFVNYDNNIVVRNCRTGYFFVSYTNGITLENCEINKSKGYEYEYVKGLNYVNCTFKGKKLHKTVNNLPKKK